MQLRIHRSSVRIVQRLYSGRAQGPQRVPEQTDFVVQQPGLKSIFSIPRFAVAVLIVVTITERG